MSHRIVRKIKRAPKEIIATLGTQGVATIHEAQGGTGLMRPYMRPIFAECRVAGSAVTVSCHPGDNLMIHAAIEVCEPGDVLVVTTTSGSDNGMFGELLGTSCVARKIAGLVINAGVRDVSELTSMNFPVWSRAISAQGTVKSSPGSVNVDIVCAGAMVSPGDVVVGDQDGVVVVKRVRAEEVAGLGAARIAKEQKTRERLRSGELGVDFYGLKAKLAELGVQYVDEE